MVTDDFGRLYLMPDPESIGIRARPIRDGSPSIARVGSGLTIPVVCEFTDGERTTQANDAITSDDALSYESNVWYGVQLETGEIGYIPDTWTTRTNGLGLPACT